MLFGDKKYEKELISITRIMVKIDGEIGMYQVISYLCNACNHI